jgi:hypothetical protein
MRAARRSNGKIVSPQMIYYDPRIYCHFRFSTAVINPPTASLRVTAYTTAVESGNNVNLASYAPDGVATTMSS